MLCGENMVSKKSKIVCSVKVSRLEFVSLPIADQLQPNFYKLPCVEQRITKLYWKSTMYSVVKCPWIFIFILLCLIFSQFLILFIYIINIGYWQALFTIWEQLENLTLQLPRFVASLCKTLTVSCQFVSYNI